MIVTCRRCFGADDVGWQRLPDNALLYICTARHDDGPYTWVASHQAGSGGDLAGDGVTDELLTPLLSCVRPGEAFVEYGIVEYRFSRQFPDLFVAYVRERGHVMVAPSRVTASSVRFGVALARLVRAGDLVSRPGPAAGAWRYNSTITYWAAAPAVNPGMLSWEAFCRSTGRSPEWTEEDRAFLA